MVHKAQAANEIQPVEETDNVPVNDAMPSQPDESNVVENKENQSSDVITNQETAAVPVNELVAPSVSDPKPEEAAQDSTCKKGTIRSLKFST